MKKVKKVSASLISSAFSSRFCPTAASALAQILLSRRLLLPIKKKPFLKSLLLLIYYIWMGGGSSGLKGSMLE